MSTKLPKTIIYNPKLKTSNVKTNIVQQKVFIPYSSINSYTSNLKANAILYNMLNINTTNIMILPC